MGNLSSTGRTTDVDNFATKVDAVTDTTFGEVERWKSYDYVIIGGGTAGCVLASRLSEDPSVSVLLLEAGSTNEGHLLSRIPLGWGKIFKTSIDWNYKTTPQSTLNNREIYWPRGKILGGTSSINALVYHRCAPEDFDEWVEKGAKGWTYEAMKPYFERAENYTQHPSYSGVDSTQRGKGGQIHTTHRPIAPISQYFIDACKNAGIPESKDINTPSGTLGVTAFSATIDAKNERSSAATAYLTPSVRARENLTIATNVLVERIVFKPDANGIPKAVGVLLSRHPETSKKGGQNQDVKAKLEIYGVHARQEVLLCAGSVGTPQILMVSGVGDARHLEDVGVKVVKDLPMVGRNLQDHLATVIDWRTKGVPTWDYIRKPLNGLFAMVRWMVSGTGPMQSLVSQVGVFVRSDDERLPYTSPVSGPLPVTNHASGPRAPDLEIAFAPLLLIDNGFTEPPFEDQGFAAGPVLLKPESTGSIKLSGKSIHDKLIIDANYLASESDLNILIRGIRLVLNIAHTEPLKSVLDVRQSTDANDMFKMGNSDPQTVSDDDIKSWLRQNSNPVWHPTSTAKIGLNPQDSVVAPDLRVHGISGLRVIDASVFPSQMSGHPCAVVVAMAERASDMIKADLSAAV
ncbi:GMC oxidoreductase [Rickenella mellea]|uniref:GMC oxidoreductase n=1 Tax=Rickenella mellea TaxID=50990 RepID=A0A4Y7PXV0_9AGAM|nr:GMC oxidoreductase [Rickenella mellea]